MEYQLFTLKNGIRVIHQQTDSPVAHFGVIINTGSRDEYIDEQGMAHFIEHTLFKGTKKRKAYQIINRIEDGGGELNAYTTKEETAVYATFLNEFYPRTIELISDIITNASFPQKELELEKEVIIEEINSYNDSPSDFEELVYDGHPIARNILGTPKTVRSFNRDKIGRFISRNYKTDEMVICSVGKIEPAKFEKLVSCYFELLSQNNQVRKREQYLGYQPQVKQIAKATFQSHCIVGTEAYELKNDKRLTLVLLSNILGGNSMNSRLNMALRERNGLAYNIEANYTPYTDTGIFMVYFGTEQHNHLKALQLVENEFARLRKNKLGTLQLSKAKKQLIGQLAIANENREDLMLTIGRSYLYFNKVDTLPMVFSKIENITSEQVLEVANQILDKDRLSILSYQ